MTDRPKDQDPNISPDLDQADSDLDETEDAESDPDGADKLGDPGKRALDSMKAKLKAEREARRELAAQLAEATKSKGDETDPAKIREAALAEARAETLKERVLDRIEARAGKLFADPEDAVALLGRRVTEFIDGDRIDSDMIAEALTELLEKKPHLAARAPEKRFTGSGDGGARKGSQTGQLTRDDLKRMTPEQIIEAKAKGRLNDLMGVD